MRSIKTSLILIFIILQFITNPLSAQSLKVQPMNWWANMRTNKLQILIHQKDISFYDISLKNTTNIRLIKKIKTVNPNYQIIYIDTKDAPPQHFNIVMTPYNNEKNTIIINYELKQRKKKFYKESFNASDVVYLLMPDRFSNGTTKNDRVEGLLEQTCDSSDPDARHGGDLQGMMQHLDYLKDLGITTIWPTPLLINDMPSHSYHGYAITNYYKIDPRYGSNNDYKTFIEEAHKKGLKVIQDMVFNHCGSKNFLFTDKPSPTWFHHNDKFVQTSFNTSTVFDKHATKTDNIAFEKGWFVESMPDLNEANPEVANYLIQNSIWWIEYADLDGIRQDTYPYNDFKMMQNWCLAIEKEYPSFNIVGESWLSNNVGVSAWQKNSKLATHNTYLPSIMDFPLMSLLNKVFNKKDNSQGLNELYEYFSQDMVYADPMHLLLFLDNHDTSRFIKNKKERKNIDRYKMALTLLLTTRGIPQLYYGDEIAMIGKKSKGDGKLRQNFPGGWKGDKVNAFIGKGMSKLQKDYLNFAKKILNWRNGNEIIAKGKFIQYAPKNGVYIYARIYKKNNVIIIINGSNKSQIINPKDYREVISLNLMSEILSNKNIDLTKSFKIESHQTYILE